MPLPDIDTCIDQFVALVMYEHMITIPDEVTMVRQHRRHGRGLAWLFILNRYLLLVFTVSDALTSTSELASDILPILAVKRLYPPPPADIWRISV